jgi:tripartite-type tricarboxylate transporter receptor subunit TctC
MISRRDVLVSSAAFLCGALAPAKIFAQPNDFPKLPIRMIVPFAPGGGVDVFARLIAQKLFELRGYTVVVENRSGGNGTVGGVAVEHANADGYMILFSAGTHVMARSVMKSPPYDPMTDFTPIARAGEAPMLLVMAPQRPEKTITEIVAAARQHPNQWTFATSALGAPGYLATVAFNKLAGLNLVIVPYRGTAPGLADVAAGVVQLMIDPVLAMLPMAGNGEVKAIALTSAKRSKLAPDIPTAAESGLPGLDHSSWYGVWGPKGMSADLVSFLNAAVNEAVKALADGGQLAKLGIEPATETPQQFSDFSRDYLMRGAELLQSANFEPM